MDHLRSGVGDLSLANMVKSIFTTKNTKINQAWWRAPVIPATQEAEAELLELWMWRFQGAEIMSLHSSLVTLFFF